MVNHAQGTPLPLWHGKARTGRAAPAQLGATRLWCVEPVQLRDGAHRRADVLSPRVKPGEGVRVRICECVCVYK